MNKFKIENPELKELDKDIFNFYFTLEKYFNLGPSKYSDNILKTEIDRLMDRSNQIKPDSKFEQLIMENIDYTLHSNEKMRDFFFYLESKTGVEDMMDTILGPDSLDTIKNAVKDYDWKLNWEYLDGIKKIGHYVVDVRKEEIQDEIKKLLPGIERDVKDYAVKHNFFKKDFDFRVDYSPLYERSYWNSTLKMVGLKKDSFSCTEKNRKKKINPSQAYLELFHELIGHAAHQHYSNKLPKSIQCNGAVHVNLPVQTISEGIAIDRQKLGVDWIKKNSKKLNITDYEIKSLDLCEKISLTKPLDTYIYGFLAEKKLRDSNFDILKATEEISETDRAAKVRVENTPIGFVDALRESAYFFGEKQVSAIREKHKDNPKINQAMSMGNWTWPVYPKAVEYFLEEL